MHLSSQRVPHMWWCRELKVLNDVRIVHAQRTLMLQLPRNTKTNSQIERPMRREVDETFGSSKKNVQGKDTLYHHSLYPKNKTSRETTTLLVLEKNENSIAKYFIGDKLLLLAIVAKCAIRSQLRRFFSPFGIPGTCDVGFGYMTTVSFSSTRSDQAASQYGSLSVVSFTSHHECLSVISVIKYEQQKHGNYRIENLFISSRPSFLPPSFP